MGEKITNILLVGLVVLLVVLVNYNYSSASPDSVAALTKKAEGSEDAKAAVASFLKTNPAPSNSDVHDIEKKVGEYLVRDIARKQTGDNTIKTKSEVEAVAAKQHEVEMHKPVMNLFGKPVSASQILMYGFSFVAFIVFFWLPLQRFRGR